MSATNCSPSERVHDLDDQGRRKLRRYPRDTFIYRLAGRDREKIASYYTPQVLTRCLVQYALVELLRDKKADDILRGTRPPSETRPGPMVRVPTLRRQQPHRRPSGSLPRPPPRLPPRRHPVVRYRPAPPRSPPTET